MDVIAVRVTNRNNMYAEEKPVSNRGGLCGG